MDIERPRTDNEKYDFKNLKQVPPFEEEFRKELADWEQRNTKAKKPWCRLCARYAFRDAVTAKINQISRRMQSTGEETQEKLTLESLKFDLEKFSNPDYFDLVQTSEAVEMRVIDGLQKIPVTIGYNEHYQCKPAKHRCGIFIPKAEYEARQKTKK